MQRRTWIFVGLAGLGAALQAERLVASAVRRPQVVTVDFVKAHAGERDALIRYYRANWARARATVLANGGIAHYRMLISADTGSRWDVSLETTYADSAAYSRAEAVFAPVLQAQGTTLIDGKRRSEMAEIVESRTTIIDR
jgi:hypothetical protein